MSDLLLYNGDLVADKYGDITLCIDEDSDVIQMANMNILLRFNSNKFHDYLGNKVYDRRIKANLNGMEIIRTECTNAIMNSDPRVKKVKQINTTLSDNAVCIVDYILIYEKSDTTELVEVDGRTQIDAFNMGGD
jgi:hypothetical protein